MRSKVKLEYAISQQEFDNLFGETLKSLETWKLKAVLKYMEEAVAIRMNIRPTKAKLRSEANNPERTIRKAKQRESRRLRLAAKQAFRESVLFGDDYLEYLKSDRWKEIRDRVITRDAGTCRVCGRPSTQVHHRDYSKETMLGLSLESLIALCGGCHHKIHFDGDTKLSDARTEKRLVSLLNECLTAGK